MIALLVACTAATLVSICATPFIKDVADEVSQVMRVEKIEVEEIGRSNLSAMVTPELILKQSGLKKDQELLKLNLKEVESKLAEIPWIKEVRLRKILPSFIGVEYAVHQARAIVVKRRIPWLVSDNGKFIAPASDFRPVDANKGLDSSDLSVQISAVAKEDSSDSVIEDWAQGLDLPVVVNESYLGDELAWLDLLENELVGMALSVHEINSDGTTVSAIMEINYKTHLAKVYLKTWSTVQPGAIDKLKKVIDYLVANRIAAVSVDLRPGKKVIVNTRKRS